jgi:alpha-ribazole phosphatase
MIIAVRHGRVVAGGLCYGRWDPPPVRTPGEDAAEVVSRLMDRTPNRPPRAPDAAPADEARPPLPGPLRIVSSPAGRCRSIALDLAPRLGLPLCVDDRLVELSVGAWEGRSWAEIEATDGARLATWMRDWESAAPPGGETLADLEARVRAAAEETTQPTLWLTHAGVIRTLRVLLSGWAWTTAMRTPVEHLQPESFGMMTPESMITPET